MTDAEKKTDEKKTEHKPIIVRNSTDLQRLRLEKLMQNPNKPVIIPEKPKERGVPVVPDFVRNVMGSSAGAGSGEFHVYRHLRRKEYARQRYMIEKGAKEKMDNEYHEKLEKNKKLADEKTAKKRKKRLKQKQKQRQNRKVQKTGSNKLKSESESSTSSSSSSENEENDENSTKTDETEPETQKNDNQQEENDSVTGNAPEETKD